MSLGQKDRIGMVWQSSAGGFCTEAAHSPLSWARSALCNTSGISQSRETDAKLMDGSFGCSGRAKGKQPATKFLHEDLFSRPGVETGRSFVGWGCQNKLHPSPAPFFFPWKKEQLLIYFFVSAPSIGSGKKPGNSGTKCPCTW